MYYLTRTDEDGYELWKDTRPIFNNNGHWIGSHRSPSKGLVFCEGCDGEHRLQEAFSLENGECVEVTIEVVAGSKTKAT